MCNFFYFSLVCVIAICHSEIALCHSELLKCLGGEIQNCRLLKYAMSRTLRSIKEPSADFTCPPPCGERICFSGRLDKAGKTVRFLDTQ